jgi:hypothetical protein
VPLVASAFELANKAARETRYLLPLDETKLLIIYIPNRLLNTMFTSEGMFKQHFIDEQKCKFC